MVKGNLLLLLLRFRHKGSLSAYILNLSVKPEAFPSWNMVWWGSGLLTGCSSHVCFLWEPLFTRYQ